MIPATIDFQLRTNADYGEELQFTEGDVSLDLTGLTFAMEVRRFPGGPLMFVVPISVLDDAVALEISRETSDGAYTQITGQQSGPLVTLSHDILVTHGDGFVECWAQGVTTIEAGVTENG